ncbi:MAG: hypothetical protein HQL27_03255 [Candidatus Omnitrophica bacterium]|nr:hypothetical protein [Candidatus Omnitrophota bacterium]
MRNNLIYSSLMLIVLISLMLSLPAVGFAVGLEPGEVRLSLISSISTLNKCGNSDVFDMKLEGNTLFTGGAGGCQSGGSTVYDVSDPSNLVKLYEIDAYPKHLGIEVRDGVYYAATEQGLFSYKLSGSSAVFMDNLFVEGEGYDIELVGNIAYYISNKTQGHMFNLSGILTSVDITDPTYMREIGNIVFNDYPIGAHPPYPTNVLVNGNYVYVGKEGFLSVDVRNPGEMSISGRNDIKKRGGPSLHRQDDMQISGDRRVFKAHRQYGIFVFFVDNTIPTKPTLETIIDSRTLALGGNIAFRVEGNKMFVVTAADRQFKVLDVSDVNNPVILAIATVDGQTNSTVEIEIDNIRKLAFVSTKGYISVFDISRFLP